MTFTYPFKFGAALLVLGVVFASALLLPAPAGALDMDEARERAAHDIPKVPVVTIPATNIDIPKEVPNVDVPALGSAQNPQPPGVGANLQNSQPQQLDVNDTVKAGVENQSTIGPNVKCKEIAPQTWPLPNYSSECPGGGDNPGGGGGNPGGGDNPGGGGATTTPDEGSGGDGVGGGGDTTESSGGGGGNGGGSGGSSNQGEVLGEGGGFGLPNTGAGGDVATTITLLLGALAVVGISLRGMASLVEESVPMHGV